MCTVSWLHEADGYVLLCNRDERHHRKPALPPRRQTGPGLHFLAPVDGDFGGSWIGVNEGGISLCLLNRYQDIPPNRTGPFTSRGLLLVDLLKSRTRCEVELRLKRHSLARFEPFHMVVLEPRKPGLLVTWDGRSADFIQNGESEMPLTSSSWKTEEVIKSRRQQFEALKKAQGKTSVEVLKTFHSSHEPAKSGFSPCMHREDAQTVSFSLIRVQSQNITFTYLPHAPCQGWDDSITLHCVRKRWIA